MSSGSSKGGGGFRMPPAQNLPGGFMGTGPTMPLGNPQTLGRTPTGNGTQAPDWAQGWFSMPWWGQPAPNVGAAMWQQMHPEQYREMQRLQQKRRTPGGGGRRRERERRARSQERPVYGPPPGGAPSEPGRGGFLGHGPFGGRQK